jgi:hypothetical protein
VVAPGVVSQALVDWRMCFPFSTCNTDEMTT